MLKRLGLLASIFRGSATASADTLALGTIVSTVAPMSTLTWLSLGTGLLAAEAAKQLYEVAEGDETAINAEQLLQQIRAGNHLATDVIEEIEKLSINSQLQAIDRAIEKCSSNDDRKPALRTYKLLKTIQIEGIVIGDSTRRKLGGIASELTKEIRENRYLLKNLLVRVTADDSAFSLTKKYASDGTESEFQELYRSMKEVHTKILAIDSKDSVVNDAFQRLEGMLGDIPRAIADQVVEQLAPQLEVMIATAWSQTTSHDPIKDTSSKIGSSVRHRRAFSRQIQEIAEALAYALTYTIEQHARDSGPDEAGRLLDDLVATLSSGQERNGLASEAERDVALVVSELPPFDKIVADDLLDPDSNLVAAARDSIGKLTRIRKSGLQSGSELQFSQFEQTYCTCIASSMDFLELFGMDVPEAQGRRYRLSVAYISLSVDDGENRIPVEVALENSDRLFIRGDAGSGKTTILQWIAVQSAGKLFSPLFLDNLSEKIPIFIRLRDIDPKDFHKRKSLFASPVAHLFESEPSGWFQSKMNDGDVIFLIDGVDEVPKESRGQLRTWILSLTNTYPDASFIVTSRVSGADEDWLHDGDFESAELPSLLPPEIEEFVANWHEAACERVSEESQKIQLRRDGRVLYKKIVAEPGLRDIAKNPLLCAMLCAFSRSSRGVLPDDKCDLYDRCVNILLESRDKERNVWSSYYANLTLKIKRTFVEDLAYWFMDNQHTTATSASVKERIAWKIENSPGLSDSITSDTIFDFLVDRSHLIQKVSADRLEFAHRTFQEYLAAKECIKQRNIGKLVGESLDDLWSQVIGLFSSMCGKVDRETLISGIIGQADRQSGERKTRLLLLAMECLDADVERVDASIEDQLVDKISGLLPPKNLTMAKQVASAGERVLRFLKYEEGRSATVNSACIRAIGLVGGPSAANLLIDYVQAPTKREISELTSIVLAKPEEFADVFDRLPCISFLDFNEFQASARVLTRCDTLLVSSANGFDISVASSMRSLAVRTLRIANGNELENLDLFSELAPFLRGLEIGRCPKLKSIDALFKFEYLESLVLRHASRLLSVSILADLQDSASLRSVEISGANALLDIRPLRHGTFTSLKLSGLRDGIYIPKEIENSVSI